MKSEEKVRTILEALGYSVEIKSTARFLTMTLTGGMGDPVVKRLSRKKAVEWAAKQPNLHEWADDAYENGFGAMTQEDVNEALGPEYTKALETGELPAEPPPAEPVPEKPAPPEEPAEEEAAPVVNIRVQLAEAKADRAFLKFDYTSPITGKLTKDRYELPLAVTPTYLMTVSYTRYQEELKVMAKKAPHQDPAALQKAAWARSQRSFFIDHIENCTITDRKAPPRGQRPGFFFIIPVTDEGPSHGHKPRWVRDPKQFVQSGDWEVAS